MSTARYVHWQKWWDVARLLRSPDYLTQGESLDNFEANLRDLYRDLISGEIPGIRKVAELTIG